MSESISPCPFCGSDAEVYPDGDMEGYSIMCSGNKQVACPLTTFGYSTHEESVAAWNMRANTTKDDEVRT